MFTKEEKAAYKAERKAAFSARNEQAKSAAGRIEKFQADLAENFQKHSEKLQTVAAELVASGDILAALRIRTDLHQQKTKLAEQAKMNTERAKTARKLAAEVGKIIRTRTVTEEVAYQARLTKKAAKQALTDHAAANPTGLITHNTRNYATLRPVMNAAKPFAVLTLADIWASIKAPNGVASTQNFSEHGKFNTGNRFAN